MIYENELNRLPLYFNILFCIVGQLIDVRHADDMAKDFTFDDAVNLCKRYGTTVASVQLLHEVRNLGQMSCECGWFEGSKSDSLTARNDCDDKSRCTKPQTRSVLCEAVFTT